MRTPTVRVTPKQVVDFWRTHRLKLHVDEKDAARWLQNNADKIEEELNKVVQEEIDEGLFEDPFTFGFPVPAYDEMFRKFSEAVQQAQCVFAERLGFDEPHGSSWSEKNEFSAIKYLIKHPKKPCTVLMDFEMSVHDSEVSPLHDRPSCDLLVTRRGQQVTAGIYERGETALEGYTTFGDVSPKPLPVPPKIRGILINPQAAEFIDELKAQFKRVFKREFQVGDPIFYDPDDVPKMPDLRKRQALSARSGIPAELMYAANKVGKIVSVTSTHALLTEVEQRRWNESIGEYAEKLKSVN